MRRIRCNQGIGDNGGRVGDCDSGCFQRLNFSGSGTFAARNNCACVSHATPCRSCHARDKGGHRFFAIRFDPFGGFFFGRAPNFADQDHRFCPGVFVEQFHTVEMRQAVNGIAPDTDARRLAVAARG
jgi:hypothetical protein